MSVPLTDMQKRKSDSNPFPRPRFYSYPTPPDREMLEKIKRPRMPVGGVVDATRPSTSTDAGMVLPSLGVQVVGSPDVKVQGFLPK